MKLVRKCGFIMAAVAASLLSSSVFANAGGGDTFKEGVNYIPIKPHLVVNYGASGKIKYIKAELSLRTEDMHSAQEVAHHMPLVRDTLIMLMSSVTDEQMADADGKEKMRLEALEKINAALAHEIHPAAVEDDHSKKEKPKADKAKKSNEHAEKEHDAKAAEHGALVSDLLFDNLVVQ